MYYISWDRRAPGYFRLEGDPSVTRQVTQRQNTAHRGGCSAAGAEQITELWRFIIMVIVNGQFHRLRKQTPVMTVSRGLQRHHNLAKSKVDLESTKESEKKNGRGVWDLWVQRDKA